MGGAGASSSSDEWMSVSPCSNKIIVGQNEPAEVVPNAGDDELESVHPPQFERTRGSYTQKAHAHPPSKP